MDVIKLQSCLAKVCAVSRVRTILSAVDRFLFEACDPIVCSAMRIAFAFLLIIYTSIWMLDSELWFTDAGVLTARSAQALNPQQLSIFFGSPSSSGWVRLALAVLFVQCGLLLLGCWSRVQMACIFVWLVSFQHRNPIICDGEDTVFRLFSFMMIFMPLDHRWSLLRALWGWPQSLARFEHAWALRLIQFEVTAIYASNAWSKFQGDLWRDGTAIYYVSKTPEYFGRGWLPGGLFEVAWFVNFATWSVLVCEMVLPIALWLGPTRRWAIGLGVGMHLAIEYSMNLFLFEWVMVVGLMAFIAPSDLRGLSQLLGRRSIK